MSCYSLSGYISFLPKQFSLELVGTNLFVLPDFWQHSYACQQPALMQTTNTALLRTRFPAPERRDEAYLSRCQCSHTQFDCAVFVVCIYVPQAVVKARTKDMNHCPFAAPTVDYSIPHAPCPAIYDQVCAAGAKSLSRRACVQKPVNPSELSVERSIERASQSVSTSETHIDIRLAHGVKLNRSEQDVAGASARVIPSTCSEVHGCPRIQVFSKCIL
eukprot:6205538-Pleurochrysis_carterae.AAC.1